MKEKLLKWLRAIEDIIWPSGHQCLTCSCLTGGEVLCPACKEKLEEQRLQEHRAYADVHCAYWYDGHAGKLVRWLKFDCIRDCAAALAPGMAEVVRDMKLPPDTVLTWVTMPEIRYRDRGIDHGRELCEAVAACAGLPVRQLLARTGANPHTQRDLNREQRLRNLTGAFTAGSVEGLNILLIDDVLTTGATAETCRRTLMEAGAGRVWVLTATRTRMKKSERAEE